MTDGVVTRAVVAENGCRRENFLPSLDRIEKESHNEERLCLAKYFEYSLTGWLIWRELLPRDSSRKE